MEDRPLLGHVVSDLHLFARWSAAERYMDEIRAAADRSDIFVLNGDIFDFRWAVLPRPGSAVGSASGSVIERAVEAAVEWLRALVAGRRGCRFFYVLGNHDGHPLFADALAALAQEEPNLTWYASHVRLGDNLFIHGDLPLKHPRRDPFSRTLSRRFWKTYGAQRTCYLLVILLGAHRLVAGCHGKRRCARRILRSFRAHEGGLTDGVTDVYFGHTHAAFSGYRRAGVTFHNTGSAVRGLRPNMCAFRAPKAGGPER